MKGARTLLIAVDGFGPSDSDALHAAAQADGHLATLLRAAVTLRIEPRGPSQTAPALTALMTGTTVARHGVTTERPFAPESLSTGSTWYASSLRAPTLFDAAAQAGMVTAALQWPATAGADIDLCLPLVEDLRNYRDRWAMAERTSSERMVREHLRARREAGVQLSHVPPDALVTEIVRELDTASVDLLAVRLTGLGTARRTHGIGSLQARRTFDEVTEQILAVLEAFDARSGDRILLVHDRPLVPTTLLVHPNTALAAHGLLRTDGPQLADFRAVVWPDGPHGALHVRRDEGSALRAVAMDVLEELARETDLRVRPVEDGVGATDATDVIAVIEGPAGILFGESATHRPLVPGDDPYYAGPRAVTDPTAAIDALASGPGLPRSSATGSWADLGVTLASAMGLRLEEATATGMREARLREIA
ncbi:alkaline phosphatase family protein [Brachybacterium timonense]|uniref:alkaline phosphatase family protein n=1 Tax=Brachybacterium timonense TaxID=2050896 RepID=UPI001FE96CB7|nr:alkaline phosphatase family protein [Brachybacterium timonense]